MTPKPLQSLLDDIMSGVKRLKPETRKSLGLDRSVLSAMVRCDRPALVRFSGMVQRFQRDAGVPGFAERYCDALLPASVGIRDRWRSTPRLMLRHLVEHAQTPRQAAKVIGITERSLVQMLTGDPVSIAARARKKLGEYFVLRPDEIELFVDQQAVRKVARTRTRDGDESDIVPLADLILADCHRRGFQPVVWCRTFKMRRATLHQIMRGMQPPVSYSTLERIAEILGVSVDVVQDGFRVNIPLETGFMPGIQAEIRRRMDEMKVTMTDLCRNHIRAPSDFLSVLVQDGLMKDAHMLSAWQVKEWLGLSRVEFNALAAKDRGRGVALPVPAKKSLTSMTLPEDKRLLKIFALLQKAPESVQQQVLELLVKDA